jgi:anti-sigma regulatory factor (Ser/Thr protein kinase)
MMRAPGMAKTAFRDGLRGRGKQGQMRSDMSFELAGGPYAVTAARLALSDLESHLEASIAFDVRLLVSELVTNSVKHARVTEEDSIMLDVRLSERVVRIEVRDPGPGFDPPAAHPPDDADKGWGLFLVEQLADEWGVEKARQAVWFQIDCVKRRSNSGESSSQSTAA